MLLSSCFAALRRVHQQERHQEHALIPALEVLQQLLGLLAVGGKVRGDDIHVVPGPDRFFLFLDLGAVQVGDLALDGLDGADLIHRLDVHGHHKTGLHIQKIRQNTVIQLRGQNLEEGHRAILPAHAEGLAGPETPRGVGAMKSFGRQAGGGQPVPGKAETVPARPCGRLLCSRCRPLRAVERARRATPSRLKWLSRSVSMRSSRGLADLDALSVDAEGEVLGLDQTVVPSGKLVLQHCACTPRGCCQNRLPGAGCTMTLLIALPGGGQIEEGKLETDGAVKIVQEITPSLKDGRLVLILGLSW